MSNPISGNHVLTFDFATYISEHGSNTVKQLVEDVMLPVVQELFPDAYYYSFPWGSEGTTKYAFISIPWADGTIDDRLFVGIKTNEASTIPTGYTDFGVFAAVPYTTTVENVVTNGNNYLRYDGKLRFLGFEDGYAIGYTSFGGSSNMKVNHLITRVKNNSSDEYKNAIVHMHSESNNRLDFYVNIDGSITNRSYYTQYPQSSLSRVGVVSKLDSGDYSHDNLYVYNAQYSALRGEWLTNSSLLNRETYQDNMWYDSAFTINGQTFDAWVYATDSNSGVGYCRKHI